MKPVRTALGRHRPAFVLASLLLLALLAPAGPLGLRARLGFLYAPLGMFRSGAGEGGAVGGEGELLRLREEIDALRARVEGLGIENGALREFQGVRFDPRSRPGRVLSANVLGRDRLAPLRRSRLIDLGSRDGVAVGQPVVAGRSLAGLVAEVGPRVSIVRLLDDPGGRADDPAARVAVQVLRPGAEGVAPVEGILIGEGRGVLRLRMVPAGSVAPGDLLVTSAADPRVPAGLLVGRVASVEEDRRTRMAEAVVVPSANLSGLSTLILLQLPEPDLQASSRGGRR